MIGEFKESKKKVGKFKKTLINPQRNENVDSFFIQYYMQSGIAQQKSLRLVRMMAN